MIAELSVAEQPRGGYDFAAFGLSDMVRMAAELRTLAEAADGFVPAAEGVVRHLRDGFLDENGEPVLEVVRLLSTRRFADLDDEQQRIARSRTEGVADPDLRCLTLDASAGRRPVWNDRTASRVHRVVPLISTETVTTAPLISALVSALGLRAEDVVAGSVRAEHERFGVFHVQQAVGSERLPDQDFVRDHDIASVLGFGGVLPGGNVFCVVMFSRATIPVEAADLFQPVAVSVRAGLLTHAHNGSGRLGLEAQRDALREHLRVLEESSRTQAAELEDAVRRLQAEAALVDTLQVVGRRLTAQLDLDTLVQDATDAATKATGAEFGAFFYNLVNQYGESYTLYTLAGVPREAFAQFPMPRNTAVFSATFDGHGTVRSDDITMDPRYGRNAPYYGMPAGHLPVHSYLAVSVISPSSQEVLGGFFFGHSEIGRFTARHEQLAEGIAGYAAIALDNARLFARQRRMATELASSMLPTVPRIAHLEIASRYLPAATGSEVGGDWFDVIELPAGRTAFVIGDVVGRGVTAASVMGQIRMAVRSYALLDLPPADLLQHVSHLAETTAGATFVTCLYAVHDPVDQSLTIANAGHLPAVLMAPGEPARLIGDGLGMPLGVGDTFLQQQTAFPPGARLTLSTDGLVESRRRTVVDGLKALVAGLEELSGELDLQAACDQLIDRLTDHEHDDDVALLHVHHLEGYRRTASLPLTADPAIGAQARAFVRDRLTEWGLADVIDRALTVTVELVSNAVRHTGEPGTLRLHHDGTRLTVDVADHGATTPRLFEPSVEEEQHRGLYLVNAFAARWGTRSTPDGKVVWAEIVTQPAKHR
ncbi:protein serine phosphatase with GAF(s) sensor(s) [Kribbella flavida DSM 17836]|uniref:protein-serine/threonine phosphatase n=1 Tax=Kribbella flavida (strain DSM 17836 / JCM 10339 / NBRC 14399) TaxID=479435 RepID=D2PM25_KRIFD|nr:SpoIIE family protein phosphatase [Kribbella flavida]ADB34393.1 protein serine phosphatase with GAF(s) sensor(s) [Kribbella flavida DSM 17836]